jgi:hypothetical protein
MILPWNSAFLKGEFWKVNLVFFNLWFLMVYLMFNVSFQSPSKRDLFPRRLPLLGARALWFFFMHELLARNMGWTTDNDDDGTFWWRTIPLLSSPLWPAASLSILLIHDCKAPVQYSGRQRTTTTRFPSLVKGGRSASLRVSVAQEHVSTQTYR